MQEPWFRYFESQMDLHYRDGVGRTRAALLVSCISQPQPQNQIWCELLEKLFGAEEEKEEEKEDEDEDEEKEDDVMKDQELTGQKY